MMSATMADTCPASNRGGVILCVAVAFALVACGVAVTVGKAHGDAGTQLVPGVAASILSALLYSFDYVLTEHISSVRMPTLA